jgi:hypothetical protein
MCGLDAKAPRNSLSRGLGTSAASIGISLVFMAFAPSGRLGRDAVGGLVAMCPKIKQEKNQIKVEIIGMGSELRS